MPVPDGMAFEESMSLGTAGLTAALCVDALLGRGLTPAHGAVLVSGATGGVGSIASAILSKLGYAVVAVTRKDDIDGYLRLLGVARVEHYAAWAADSGRALGKEEFAGAIDTIGGTVLENVLKRLRYGGAVAACGMAAGTQLETSVFPFILRGVSLLGVDSVQCPVPKRVALWAKLATEWQVPCLRDITQTVGLEGLSHAMEGLLTGARRGRTLVAVG